MTKAPPALQISDFHKSYGTVRAVTGLDLEVGPGEFFGLLGPNGAGKSTTIHAISGIATFTRGSIKVFGIDVQREYREARKLVGLAPQEFNIDIFATVEKTLDYCAGYFGLDRSTRQERIEALLERFDLKSHRKKSFRALSGGLKRRMMLARALVHDPQLLILDEPTAGVDVELRLELWRYLKELNQEGKTIIMSSHYLEEIERLCDRVAILAEGRLVLADRLAVLTKPGRSLEKIYLEATGKKEETV